LSILDALPASDQDLASDNESGGCTVSVAAGVHAGKCEKAFYAVDNVLTLKAAIDEAEERGIRRAGVNEEQLL
jgi:hypothetical protein